MFILEKEAHEKLDKFLKDFIQEGYKIKIISLAQKKNKNNKFTMVKISRNGLLSLYFSLIQDLSGRIKFLPIRVSDGSIIERFMHVKVPPEHSDDIVCPSFLELKWAYGCPFNCAYCYLQGTLRLLSTKKRPAVKDIVKVKRHLLSFLKAPLKEPEILNSGELCDSLMYEKSKYSITRNLIPLFEDTITNKLGHKILLVTKSNNIEGLLENSNSKHIIVSFSINSENVFKKWEKGTPHPFLRIEAAKRLSEIGFEVRVRIDPIIPFPKTSWKEDYYKLIDRILSSFTPSRLTIGSLRGLPSTIRETKDKSWIVFLKSPSKWGLRQEYKTRREIYKTIINYMRKEYGYKNIALCKETVQMWQDLEIEWKKCACNCV